MSKITPLLLFFVVGGLVCNDAAAEEIELDPESWNIRFSYGMPKHPYAEGSGWAFDFPVGTNCRVKEGCPGVHYVTTRYTKAIPPHAVLTLSFKVEANENTVFNFKLEKDNVCEGPPASVRAFLQRAEDDLYAADNRFWSNPVSVVLAAGDYKMMVELSADQWTNVNGEQSQSGFGETLSQMGNIGVTFGGGCFFGHGTNASGGNARFVLTRLELKQ